MLLQIGTVRRPCKKGDNLLATRVAGKRTVEYNNRKVQEDIITLLYIEGMPFGLGNVAELSAPCDLRVDDVVEVSAQDETVARVLRGDEDVWVNEGIVERERRRAGRG